MCFVCIHDSMLHEIDELETPTQAKNIKLHELCSFLPADRAKSFHRMLAVVAHTYVPTRDAYIIRLYFQTNHTTIIVLRRSLYVPLSISLFLIATQVMKFLSSLR